MASGPPAVLLVTLVDEEETDVEEHLIKMVASPSCSEGGERETSVASSSSHSQSVTQRESKTVWVTFVSEDGIVFGHDISPGNGVAESVRGIIS